MFWRFGFNNGSSIDSLLDKEDISVEAILDEDDLLQECKSQNTRLIDYFQRVDVLQKLLAYVTGQIEGDEKGQFKYPYVATEVLCSEIWSIVETCVEHREQLLRPFWETVLDRSPEDMKTQTVMASHFAKVNAVFLNKKPTEMLAFIQAQSSVVERILRHIETPSFVDLLVRIIQLDERGTGVLEWLSSEQLMGRLIEMLSPAHTSDVHNIVAELIKGIISMATPSPGAGLTEGLQNGPASNRFARELAHRDSITKLVDYVLHDFGPGDSAERTESTGYDTDAESDAGSLKLPNVHSSTSSVVNSISIIIELIRKNNSDYFEPYLFHTLRNRLIQVQQQLQSRGEEGRDTLEQSMKEMVDRMGVVHLGPVLEIMCERLGTFQKYLQHPRSITGAIDTTVGSIVPLTFERYRICELFAELLHCSNMALLNRSAEWDHLYDSEGRLQGGLSALEELASVISTTTGRDRDTEAMDEGQDEIEPALELPVHGTASSASHDSPSLIDSDEDMSDDEPGSSDDDAMEEIVMLDEPLSQSPPPSSHSIPIPVPPVASANALSPASPSAVPSSPSARSPEITAQGATLKRAASIGSNSDSESSTLAGRSRSSRRSSRRTTLMDSSIAAPLPIGEKLKRRLLDVGILSTLLDLFFEYPWNNFLHSAVYDLLHQILTGHVDSGVNRELAVSLFRDAQVMQRIVDGQRRNDSECSKPKGVRLGYMGHLTLISEDIITALERYPADLRQVIAQHTPEGWDEYVHGRYDETKQRDTRLLGGGKPTLASSGTRSAAQWRVDEADATSSMDSGESRGEFRRASSARPTRESSADFGPALVQDNDDGDESEQFARLGRLQYPSGAFGADDEDEDGGWLSTSGFSLGNPPVSARQQGERRPLASNGFDDAFAPSIPSEDPFSSADDDGFGPFSGSSSSADPFTFAASFSEEMEDASYEAFGDFGDFQAASGELTPTGGSWTFASDSSSFASPSSPASDSPPRSQSPLKDPDSPEVEKRMPMNQS
ncbi:hypothetical protein HGRIS_012696 [Hohenbuehelia grisea]|uniref:SAPS-domain-containing protein n=1 Tax=Hohenbuehelia grisea TaxID=104357 RepID=A0ABR3ITA5_9AGAR